MLISPVLFVLCLQDEKYLFELVFAFPYRSLDVTSQVLSSLKVSPSLSLRAWAGPSLAVLMQFEYFTRFISYSFQGAQISTVFGLHVYM